MFFTPTRTDQYLNRLTLDGRSDNTIRAYRSDLDVAISICGGLDATGSEWKLAGWLNANRTKYAPKTLLRFLTAWRGYARFHGEPTFLASYRSPKPAPATPHPIPEGIEGVRKMIKSTRNPRHRALCALTGLLGLRVNEAINVRADDFTTRTVMIDGQPITVRELRVVYGKGGRQRDVPVSDAVWAHLERAVMIAPPGRPIVPLTNRGARAAITRHGRNAKLSRRVSSHDMRATLATAAYDNSKDLRAVQEVLGHANSKTTQVYTNVSTIGKINALAVV